MGKIKWGNIPESPGTWHLFSSSKAAGPLLLSPDEAQPSCHSLCDQPGCCTTSPIYQTQPNPRAFALAVLPAYNTTPPNPFISGKLLLIFQVSAKTTLHHRTSSQALSTPISHSCSIPFVSFKSHLYSFILCLMHVYFIRLEVVKEQGPSSLFIRHVAGLVHCDQWRLINSL